MEIALIVLVAIMLFPPRELPKLARSAAKFYGQIRRTADDFRSAILEDEDLNEPIREIRSVYNEARFEVNRTREAAQRELAKARMEARMAAKSVTDAVDPRQLGKESAKSEDASAANDDAAAQIAEPDPKPAIESTAGSNRPEDAPPRTKPPRSKLPVPPTIRPAAGVTAAVPTAPVPPAVEPPEAAVQGSGATGDEGDATEGVA